MSKNVLRIYNFDIDDNLLSTDTKISGFELVNKSLTCLSIRTISDIQKMLDNGDIVKKDFSTSEFAIVKEDNVNYYFDFNTAFLNFRDCGKKGIFAFVDDIRVAIKSENFSPSWNDFKNCLINGNLFSLVTARGHNSLTLRRLAEIVIFNDDIADNGLTGVEYLDLVERLRNFHIGTDYEVIAKYLNDCEFIGVSSQDFADRYLDSEQISPKNPSEFKEIFLKDFFLKCNKIANKHNLRLEYGMSDDDSINVSGVIELFKLLKSEYKDVTFAVYSTEKYKETKYME